MGDSLLRISLFNSATEFAIRTVVLLAELESPMTLDRIVAYDFIATYPTEFNIGSVDINGKNHFKFSEFALRRESTKEAIKLLLFKNLVDIAEDNACGFKYLISLKGNIFAENLKNEYLMQYRSNIARVEDKFCSTDDLHLATMLYSRTVNELGE